MLVPHHFTAPVGWPVPQARKLPVWRGTAMALPLFAVDAMATRDIFSDDYFNEASYHRRRSVNLDGQYGRCSYASAIGGGPPLDLNRGLITTSTGNGQGDFTITVVAEPKAEARRVRLFHQRLGSGSSNQFILEVNSNNGSVASGYITFGTYAVAWTRITAGPGLVDGELHWFTCVRKGTRLHIYVDGKEVNNGAGTLRDVYAGGQVTAIGGPAGLSGDQNCTEPMLFAAGWNRALTPTEVYTLWHPRTRWSWLLNPAVPYDLPGAAPVVANQMAMLV